MGKVLPGLKSRCVNKNHDLERDAIAPRSVASLWPPVCVSNVRHEPLLRTGGLFVSPSGIKDNLGVLSMSQHAKEEYVKRVIADKITDALEDALLNGMLRRKDIQYWYEKIGRLCDIPDLIPLSEEERIWNRLVQQTLLKQRIKERLGLSSSEIVTIPEQPKGCNGSVAYASFFKPKQPTQWSTENVDASGDDRRSLHGEVSSTGTD